MGLMARLPPGDLTLINDNGSSEERRRGETAGFNAGRRTYPRKFSDAFDALEFGLPLGAAAPHAGPANPDDQPMPGGTAAATPSAPRPADVYIPLMAAALVIGICAAIGGAAAVLVFHERVLHITAVWTANR
jgi:hypothetical protein